MVSPIRKGASGIPAKSPKKKKTKAVDVKIEKAAKKVPIGKPKGKGEAHAISKRLAKEAQSSADRAKQLASSKGIAIKKAALKMQKSGVLSRRMHMTQQTAAAKKAAASEKAKKDKKKQKEKEERKKRLKKFFRA